jgi:hypothetical protein
LNRTPEPARVMAEKLGIADVRFDWREALMALQPNIIAIGRERLPVLVAGLGQYDSWATLIPAVYGVSPAEFEARW